MQRRIEMKRWSNTVTKRIMVLLMSVSLMGSPLMKAVPVYATQTTTQESTENTNIDANGTLGKNSDVGIDVTKSIAGTIGKSVKISFNLKSSDSGTIKLKSVYPVIDSMFPFETSGDAYKVIKADDANKQAVLPAEYKMTARSDLQSGYQSVKFIGEYSKTGSDGTTKDYYVIKTINIYFSIDGSKSSTKGNKSTTGGKTDGETDTTPDDTDIPDTPTDDGSSGSDSSGEAEAPKLIITGYDSDPKKIMAGQSFKIKIYIQNSSKTTNVCNAKFLVGDEAGNFLPTSGSNAVFVDKIAAGETGDVEIELKTSAELAQKNYRLVVKGDFDDGNGNSFTAGESVYIPVYQEVKLGITDVSMSPESIGIGSQGSLMFTINNQSGAGIYNVKVNTKDDAVTSDECYVGNIAANSSAYATVNVTGAADNSDKGTVKVVISYEDSEGTASEIEQDVTCSVGEDAIDDMSGDVTDDYEDAEYTEGPAWWVYVIIGIVVLAVIVVIVVIIVKKRKKKMAELLAAEDEDEDGLLSVSDGLLQEEENKEQDDTIRVEGNDTGSFDFANGEEDKEHEDF